MQRRTDASTSFSQMHNVPAADENDPLMVHSVEKAFRVLTAFDARHHTLSLSQLAVATGLDKSAAQRFAHTLVRLGYLRKDPRTKHFELTPRNLTPAFHYIQSNALVQRAVPYLAQLSAVTEEASNLTMMDGVNIVFVARFTSRHAVTTQTTVGSLAPAYCSAPGLAMMSRLPTEEVEAILDASTLCAHTPYTIWERAAVLDRVRHAAEKGYVICTEQILMTEVSVAAPVLDASGRAIAALNLSVSKLRFDTAVADEKFASLVCSTAQALSN